MWGEGGVCSWQQGPGRVVRVSYEPCMWHLKDPPVPCNPGNLLAEGGGRSWGCLSALELHPSLHIGVRVGVTAGSASHLPPSASQGGLAPLHSSVSIRALCQRVGARSCSRHRGLQPHLYAPRT